MPKLTTYPITHMESIRRSRGIARTELAERVGVSRQTVFSIESGGYLPNVALALKIARELNATVEQLFG